MSFKEINVDLNTLFNLTYSFDSLKLTLEGVLGNQKELIAKIKEMDQKLEKIDELEKEQKVTDKKIKGIENSVGTIKKVKESKQKDKEKEKEKDLQIDNKIEKELERDKEMERQKELENNKQNEEEKETENEKRDEDEDKDTHNQKDDEEVESKIVSKKDQDEDDKEDGDDDKQKPHRDNVDIAELKIRVSALEKKIQLGLPKQTSVKHNESDSNEELLLHKYKIDELSNQLEETQKKLADVTSQLETIKVKVNDFNIFDLFKDCQIEGGNLDGAKLLIMNLETKVFKKIALIDEKMKMLEEDTFKSKGEISNIKMQNDSNTRGINNMKDLIQQLGDQLENTNNYISKELPDVESKLREELKATNKQLEDLYDLFKKEIKDIKQKLKPLEDEFCAGLQNGGKQGGGSFGDDDLKYMKELFKKVNELEKQLKDLTKNFSIDSIKEDINRLKNDMAQKASLKDLFDINEKVNHHGNGIFGLKDAMEKLIEERTKLANEVNFVLKKLEMLNAQVVNLKSNEVDGMNPNKNNIFDMSKYVEFAAFNDFLKSYGKEQDKLKREIDDLKRFLDEIAQILKTKASDEDLKNLEGFLIAKIEELRLLFSKKFADKIDTAKSIKYLDAQLKHIIEVYIKKADKGDNWLLAKKPVGGFSCASCEAYIGELQEKQDYLAWNKYPMREGQDKAYRVGNGFSRMLNMLNLDVKNTHESTTDPQYESDGDLKHKRNQRDDTSQKRGVLPSITVNKGEESLNMSVDHAMDENSRSPSDEKQPKIVKIYRKNKLTSIEIPKGGK